MGGYYARAEGWPEEVANAIRDHYKPVGPGDEVPTAPVTVAVSLADKLDSIAGFFVNELRPTGSKDPYALRRSAMGAAAVIISGGLRLNLFPAIFRATVEILIKHERSLAQEAVAIFARMRSTFGDRASHEALMATLNSMSTPKQEAEGLIVQAAKSSQDVLDFFADRLKVQQREAGVRHDLIDAVFALGGEDDLVRLLARVKALQSFIATEDGANLPAEYKRAANILKKEPFNGSPTISLSYAPENEEAALLAALDAAELRAADAVEREDFEGAMSALASLRAPIDAFFDKVTVNDTDEKKREARLGILVRVRNAAHQVADFSRIEG